MFRYCLIAAADVKKAFKEHKAEASRFSVVSGGLAREEFS